MYKQAIATYRNIRGSCYVFCLTLYSNSIIIHNMNNKLDDTEIEETGLTELGSIEHEAVELTDENITQDQIREMIMLCIPKPPKVSWERWQRVLKIRYPHEHVIQLASAGMDQKTIAEITGYGAAQISKLLRHPDIKKQVHEEVSKIYGEDHKKAIKEMSSKAFVAIDDALSHGSEKVRNQTAQWVLEHSVGKATQVVEEKKTSLSEVIVRIEQMRNELRDVGSSSENLPKEKHPFDTVIEEVIPKGMIIGKRGGSSEGKTE